MFGGDGHDLIRERSQVEHTIAKCTTELNFATTQDQSFTKQIEQLKTQITEEESKVRQLLSGGETQSKAAKMQE